MPTPYRSPHRYNESREAAAEVLRAYQAATEERRRARIWAEPEGEPRVDVTEHVVSLLDMITTSMDWGSDFWTDTDLESFVELCRLLKFAEVPEAPETRPWADDSGIVHTRCQHCGRTDCAHYPQNQ